MQINNRWVIATAGVFLQIALGALGLSGGRRRAREKSLLHYIENTATPIGCSWRCLRLIAFRIFASRSGWLTRRNWS